MAISTDFLIDLPNRMIYYNPAGSGDSYSVNELYSYLMDYFDESGTIDDTIPMTSQTATQYTLVNGWYINDDYYASYEYLYGGGVKSIGYDALTYNYGIRKLTFQASGYVNAVVGDLGREVGYAGDAPADTGTLLDFNNTDRVWIVRVDDTGDTFANTGTAIDLDNGTGTGAGTLSVASATGENIWVNLYTIGTLQANTQIYLYQADAEITPWWDTGHLDVIVEIQRQGVLIDQGYLTIFARQYTKLYDHFLTDTSSGGRIPIPLATFADSNNDSGYLSFTYTPGTGTFQDGEIVQKSGDATIQGVITVVGTGPDSLTYYLFQHPITNNFSNTDSIVGLTSTATGTVSSVPGNAVPASYSGITFTFGATSQDLNNTNGFRPYDVIINVNNYRLSELYPYLKYINRYGSATALNGYTGADYTAVGDLILYYTSEVGAFTEGLTVTGANSGATGVIVSDHTTLNILTLKEVVGTFEDNEQITDTSTGDATTAASDAVDAINPDKQSPFGTFAGGKFFGARGVWLDNVHANDGNNFELEDTEGTRQVPPTTIPITVGNTESGDRVSVFETTGDNEIVKRNQFLSHATNNVVTGTEFYVTTEIPVDTPSSGVIRVVDNSLNREKRYAYSSYTNADPDFYFTLDAVTLDRTYEGSDYAYVPYLDEQATGTSVSTTITYYTDRFVVTRVRIAGMQPFSQKGQITSSGLPVTVIRNPDSIYA